MYRFAFLIAALLVAALGLIFGTLNAEPVTVDLLWVQLRWPLGLVLLLALAAGIGLGLLLSWLSRVLPLKARLRAAERRAERLAAEPVSTTLTTVPANAEDDHD